MAVGKRWIWAGVFVIAAAAGIGAAAALAGPVAYGRIAVTYAAKQTCTCLYVARRSQDACVADFPEDARTRLKLSVVDGNVRAKAYGLFSAEAVTALFDKRLDGFGELFRMISFNEIGSAAMMSRATAGTVGRKAIFVLPGSPAAVRLAMEKLIVPELGHIMQQLNKGSG